MREVIMTSKRYPDEFKMEAVKQVVDRGHNVHDFAGRLGIPFLTLEQMLEFSPFMLQI
jgi:transposase-like protein